ncbi:MAG TPA: hypothetical protein VIB00_03870 [Pyrinomonadaceae bacterium]|jgi:hypothetical protein
MTADYDEVLNAALSLSAEARAMLAQQLCIFIKSRITGPTN